MNPPERTTSENKLAQAPIADVLKSDWRTSVGLLQRLAQKHENEESPKIQVVLHKSPATDNWTVLGSAVKGMIRGFLSVPPPTAPLSKDLESLKRGLEAVLGLQEQKVLEEKEAEAVLEFIIGRFLERRFDRIIQRALPDDETRVSFYRSRRSLK